MKSVKRTICLNSEELQYEEWIDQGIEDIPVELHEDEQEDLLDDHAVPNHDLPNVDIVDVWRCGDTVRPLKDEEAQVLARLREVYRSKRKENVPSLKSRDQKKVMEQICLINGLVENVALSCKTISDVNYLLYACSFVVAERLGLTRKGKGVRKAKEDPWWKRRIEKNIGV